MTAIASRDVPGVGAARQWDRQWESAWKAHAGNPWFHHQADVHGARLRAPAGAPAARVLKTDAFEEACGFRPLGATLDRASTVLMDVSPRIVARGVRDGGALGCATDVRRLGFRPGTFDLVVSTSTLDHFDDVRDIDLALRELREALQPGGRLFITLDNGANPILRVRDLVHRLTGPMGGLIPFRMGRTLSRRRLVGALERAGFEVLETGYLLHTPRIVGLWVGEWAARAGRVRWARVLRGLFATVDGAAGALPTRRWTGHFVFADCRRPRQTPALHA